MESSSHEVFFAHKLATHTALYLGYIVE